MKTNNGSIIKRKPLSITFNTNKKIRNGKSNVEYVNKFFWVYLLSINFGFT